MSELAEIDATYEIVSTDLQSRLPGSATQLALSVPPIELTSQWGGRLWSVLSTTWNPDEGGGWSESGDGFLMQ